MIVDVEHRYMPATKIKANNMHALISLLFLIDSPILWVGPVGYVPADGCVR